MTLDACPFPRMAGSMNAMRTREPLRRWALSLALLALLWFQASAGWAQAAVQALNGPWADICSAAMGSEADQAGGHGLASHCSLCPGLSQLGAPPAPTAAALASPGAQAVAVAPAPGPHRPQPRQGHLARAPPWRAAAA